MSLSRFKFKGNIVGCDEAGRGCLAGPVVAGAVILPKDYFNKSLNDSKLLSASKRIDLAKEIKEVAVDYAIGTVCNKEIDDINILNASFLAMHRAIDQIKNNYDLLLIDGNRFNPYKKAQHKCIIKGDSKYISIAAASVLAKTYRDDLMKSLHENEPNYFWNKNKGYPTKQHREAIIKNGISKYHRISFRLIPNQLTLNL